MITPVRILSTSTQWLEHTKIVWPTKGAQTKSTHASHS